MCKETVQQLETRVSILEREQQWAHEQVIKHMQEEDRRWGELHAAINALHKRLDRIGKDIHTDIHDEISKHNELLVAQFVTKDEFVQLHMQVTKNKHILKWVFGTAVFVGAFIAFLANIAEIAKAIFGG